MSLGAYFDQAEQNTNLLLTDKRYKEAYEQCVKLMNKFPEEQKFIKLKRKIEETVAKENQEIIDGKIEEIKSLWEKENYVEIVKTLQPLLKVAPHHKKLNKLIAKAQEAYRKKVDELQKKFEKTQREKLDKLLNENEQQLMEELFLLERNNSGNRKVLALTSEYRDKLIQQKIKSKEELIYSDKFDDIHNFISQLKRIDGSNNGIKELENNVKRLQYGTQVEEKKEFLYRSDINLNTLMRLKKYEKATIVAGEILEIDPNNNDAKKIMKIAQRKLFKINQAASVASILKNHSQLKKEYNKNKDQFIKI